MERMSEAARLIPITSCSIIRSVAMLMKNCPQDLICLSMMARYSRFVVGMQ